MGDWLCEAEDGTPLNAPLPIQSDGFYKIVCNRFLPKEAIGFIGNDAADYRFAPPNLYNKHFSPITFKTYFSFNSRTAAFWSLYYIPETFDGAASLIVASTLAWYTLF